MLTLASALLSGDIEDDRIVERVLCHLSSKGLSTPISAFPLCSEAMRWLWETVAMTERGWALLQLLEAIHEKVLDASNRAILALDLENRELALRIIIFFLLFWAGERATANILRRGLEVLYTTWARDSKGRDEKITRIQCLIHTPPEDTCQDTAIHLSKSTPAIRREDVNRPEQFEKKITHIYTSTPNRLRPQATAIATLSPFSPFLWLVATNTKPVAR